MEGKCSNLKFVAGEYSSCLTDSFSRLLASVLMDIVFSICLWANLNSHNYCRRQRMFMLQLLLHLLLYVNHFSKIRAALLQWLVRMESASNYQMGSLDIIWVMKADGW